MSNFEKFSKTEKKLGEGGGGKIQGGALVRILGVTPPNHSPLATTMPLATLDCRMLGAPALNICN